MRASRALWATQVLILVAALNVLAADEITAVMKKILDHRADDFASIRTKPRALGETMGYTSTITVPGAMECYITQNSESRFTNSCGVFETKTRAVLVVQYKKYVSALRAAVPASWVTWTQPAAEADGEYTYFGPDRSHPHAAVWWDLEGMNKNFYELSVTFYGDGNAEKKSR